MNSQSNNYEEGPLSDSGQLNAEFKKAVSLIEIRTISPPEEDYEIKQFSSSESKRLEFYKNHNHNVPVYPEPNTEDDDYSRLNDSRQQESSGISNFRLKIANAPRTSEISPEGYNREQVDFDTSRNFFHDNIASIQFEGSRDNNKSGVVVIDGNLGRADLEEFTPNTSELIDQQSHLMESLSGFEPPRRIVKKIEYLERFERQNRSRNMHLNLRQTQSPEGPGYEKILDSLSTPGEDTQKRIKSLMRDESGDQNYTSRSSRRFQLRRGGDVHRELQMNTNPMDNSELAKSRSDYLHESQLYRRHEYIANSSYREEDIRSALEADSCNASSMIYQENSMFSIGSFARQKFVQLKRMDLVPKVDFYPIIRISVANSKSKPKEKFKILTNQDRCGAQQAAKDDPGYLAVVKMAEIEELARNRSYMKDRSNKAMRGSVNALRLKEAERSRQYKPKLPLYGSKMNARVFSSFKKMKIADRRENHSDTPNKAQIKTFGPLPEENSESDEFDEDIDIRSLSGDSEERQSQEPSMTEDYPSSREVNSFSNSIENMSSAQKQKHAQIDIILNPSVNHPASSSSDNSPDCIKSPEKGLVINQISRNLRHLESLEENQNYMNLQNQPHKKHPKVSSSYNKDSRKERKKNMSKKIKPYYVTKNLRKSPKFKKVKKNHSKSKLKSLKIKTINQGSKPGSELSPNPSHLKSSMHGTKSIGVLTKAIAATSTNATSVNQSRYATGHRRGAEKASLPKMRSKPNESVDKYFKDKRRRNTSYSEASNILLVKDPINFTHISNPVTKENKSANESKLDFTNSPSQNHHSSKHQLRNLSDLNAYYSGMSYSSYLSGKNFKRAAGSLLDDRTSTEKVKRHLRSKVNKILGSDSKSKRFYVKPPLTAGRDQPADTGSGRLYKVNSSLLVNDKVKKGGSQVSLHQNKRGPKRPLVGNKAFTTRQKLALVTARAAIVPKNSKKKIKSVSRYSSAINLKGCHTANISPSPSPEIVNKSKRSNTEVSLQEPQKRYPLLANKPSSRCSRVSARKLKPKDKQYAGKMAQKIKMLNLITGPGTNLNDLKTRRTYMDYRMQSYDTSPMASDHRKQSKKFLKKGLNFQRETAASGIQSKENTYLSERASSKTHLEDKRRFKKLRAQKSSNLLRKIKNSNIEERLSKLSSSVKRFNQKSRGGDLGSGAITSRGMTTTGAPNSARASPLIKRTRCGSEEDREGSSINKNWLNSEFDPTSAKENNDSYIMNIRGPEPNGVASKLNPGKKLCSKPNRKRKKCLKSGSRKISKIPGFISERGDISTPLMDNLKQMVSNPNIRHCLTQKSFKQSYIESLNAVLSGGVSERNHGQNVYADELLRYHNRQKSPSNWKFGNTASREKIRAKGQRSIGGGRGLRSHGTKSFLRSTRVSRGKRKASADRTRKQTVSNCGVRGGDYGNTRQVGTLCGFGALKKKTKASSKNLLQKINKIRGYKG